MEDDILQVIEEEIANNPSLEEMKTSLLDKGFQERDVNAALQKHGHRFVHKPQADKFKKNIKLLTGKELCDRIGYGFSTHQFINILFYQTALVAGLGSIALFLVGLFNGLKNIISVNISSFFQEYNKEYRVKKGFIKTGGIIFGFTFLFMALARVRGLVWLFAIAMLIGSIGVVTYGDMFNRLIADVLKRERRGKFLRKMSQYGLIVTAISLLVSGFLMEWIPVDGKTFSCLGLEFTAHGYLISFFITAVAFIFSGLIMSYIKDNADNVQYQFRRFSREYTQTLKRNLKAFTGNKFMFMLMLASVLAGLAQTLGNSYYGIFIYENFQDQWLGGFLNVAVIYAVAILVSILGPWLTKKVNKTIGLSPMLVFGTLLVAMMPFIAAWGPHLFALGVANALSIIGSAIVGAAQGLLARKLLKEKEREIYFTNLSSIITIPFIVLLPLGAWMTQVFSITFLFKVIVGILVLLVTTIYIILVSMANKRTPKNINA